MVNETPGHSTTFGDADLPALFRSSDRSAVTHQAESFRIVRTQLLVLLLATAVAALAERIGSRGWAVLAALLYALTVAVGVRLSRRRARADWQANRDVAEVLKSLAWQYMVHGGPFHSRVVDPDGVFAERLEQRLRELRRVGWEDPRGGPDGVREAGQITPVMRSVRAKPFETRRDIYLRDRLLEQFVWYRDRAARSHRAAVRWSAVTTVLTLLALAAAAVRAAGLIGWDLTGPLSAAAAAGVAWQEVRRHRPLTYAHSLVEQDLDTLRVAMSTTVTEDGWADAVAEAERVVSPQYTDWLGRFGD
jgi:SMODS and SLOG-associating 2TM effector domain 3/SMODS and SLOG-associating 2TM effector domain 1